MTISAYQADVLHALDTCYPPTCAHAACRLGEPEARVWRSIYALSDKGALEVTPWRDTTQYHLTEAGRKALDAFFDAEGGQALGGGLDVRGWC